MATPYNLLVVAYFSFKLLRIVLRTTKLKVVVSLFTKTLKIFTSTFIVGVHLQSEEWRDRLVVERISGHIAYCHDMQCGDQICCYFSWFPRHYNQCANSSMYLLCKSKFVHSCALIFLPLFHTSSGTTLLPPLHFSPSFLLSFSLPLPSLLTPHHHLSLSCLHFFYLPPFLSPSLSLSLSSSPPPSSPRLSILS